MKKPKLNINFGEGGFQGWLVRHCEKMILGVVILLALWVIWGGYGLSGLEGEKTPDKLREIASSKRNKITNMTWDDFKQANPDRLQRKVTKAPSEVAIDPLMYPPHTSWNPSDFPRNEPRTDPEIYPPANLKAVAFVGPLAYQPVDGVMDQLTGEKGKGAAGAQAVSGGLAGPMGPMGVAGAEPGADPGAEPGGGDLLSEIADGLSGPAPGEDGMSMPGGGGAQRVVPLESSHYQAPPQSMAQTRYAVVVMAVVPHQKQWEEYDRKLKESLDHDLLRDQPNYLTIFMQRVDVTDDPTIDPATIPDEVWEKGTVSRNVALDDAKKWAGYPGEIVDASYLSPIDPSVHPSLRIGLTQPIPPFVQRDLWEAMAHPDIPLTSPRQAPTMIREEAATEEGGDEVPGLIPGVGVSGRQGGGGMMGPGMGGMMGPGMGGTTGPGMMGGMMGGPGMMGPGMPGMAGPGMMGGSGMGDGMMGGYQQQSVGPQVKYKLVRATDFGVEPGRKYRYRMKVVVDDPNNPGLTNLYPKPRLAALAREVQTRVSAEGAKTYRSSEEWSAPSDVVSLPAEHWFYAGKVSSDSGQYFVENTRPVRREPTAKVVAVVHDSAKGADVPVEQEVRPGTTFNLKTDVNIVHPIKGMIHNFKEYALRTDTLVADILGGDVIPNVVKERSGDKMTVPGEILLIDADGNLFVQDEAEDIEDFLRYVPPEVKETKPMPGNNPMDPMGGGLLAEPGAEPGADDPMGPMGRGRPRRNR